MHSFPPRLIDGYRTFTSHRLPTEQSRYRELSERGQSPEVMVIGCCDSRVSPEVIFDVGPGELFVVRNIANLVPVYQPDGGAHGVSAALEFAVQVRSEEHTSELQSPYGISHAVFCLRQSIHAGRADSRSGSRPVAGRLAGAHEG